MERGAYMVQCGTVMIADEAPDYDAGAVTLRSRIQDTEPSPTSPACARPGQAPMPAVRRSSRSGGRSWTHSPGRRGSSPTRPATTTPC